jgi:uracil-DNA glycosylase
MSDSYYQLLDGVIGHLRELKQRGERYVNVSPATLELLAGAAPAKGATQGALPPPVAKSAPPAVAPPPMTPPKPTRPVIKETKETPPAKSTTAKPAAKSDRDSTKEARMAALRTQALVCERCSHLVKSRTQVVFGVGDVNSPLMFVGEAPGADEDLQGEPFVGKAGQLLTKIIEAMGFTRQTVYIANILKCRPDTPGQTAGNRKPTPEEMQTCLPHLLAQIEIIKPKIMVALGATAVEGLLGKTVGITKLRGHPQDFHGTTVMPTYHPAYLLRNQSLAIKREVWEDMLQVLEKLDYPISEKQRNYFLAKKL